jgi:hypothetical protein
MSRAIGDGFDATDDTRLAALNFEERFATIQQAAPEAVGD